MNKWQWKVFSVTTILALALVLCPPAAVNAVCTDPLGCVTIGPGEDIHIAYALVTEGPDASLGIDSRNGVEIAIDDSGGQILGHDIQFDGQNEDCSSAGGLAAGTALAADTSIVAVIGTSCSSAASAAMPLLSAAGLAMVSPSNTVPDLTELGNPNNYPGYLRVSWNDKVQGAAAAQFAWEYLEVSTAATISDGSGYADYLQQAFAAEFISLGGTITIQETIDPDQTDMSAELASIVAAGDPELIYFPVFMPAGGYIISQARGTVGLEDTFLIGSDGLYTEDVVTATGGDVEGFMVTGPDFTKFSAEYTDTFLPAYQTKFGTEPISLFHAHAYDAFMLIKAAIEDVAIVDGGSIQIGRQALWDALYGTTNHTGLTGTLTCNATGDCADPHIAVYEFHTGQFPPEYIWPDMHITGIIEINQPVYGDINNKFYVDAYPDGGGPGRCGGPALWNGTDNNYQYTLEGCDSSKDYAVVAHDQGYTFNEVTVTDFIETPSGSFTATAPDITPVARVFSGKVTKPNGDAWVGFVLRYKLDAVGESDPFLTTPPTGADGVFTIPGITDASRLYIPRVERVGYDFGGGDNWVDPPLGNDTTDWDYTSRGTRNINGYIQIVSGNQACRAGVTITVSASGALTQTTLTDSNGDFYLNNLEPLNTYVVTPTRSGCVFTPASQTIDIRFGDPNTSIVFQVPNTGVLGRVKTTLGEDASLAYYLIATYTTSESVSYSTSVNWADGNYSISVPPNIGGTLTISRVGGPAAFGYQTAEATRTGITLTNAWSEQNFTLVPSRTISGKIVGQNGVPVQKSATVDFGYALRWTQPNIPVNTYSINAQPKLYYLSPVENGIISSSPLRFLANLTTAPSVTTANFTLNLKTYLLEGCLYDANGNDSLVLSAVRFRPAALYGSVTYSATLNANVPVRCGLGSYYYSVTLPKGIVGALEVDNHTLWGGGTIDGMIGDKQVNYSVFGNRAITGHIYTPNPNFNLNGDFSGNGILVLRDAATNDLVQTNGDLEISGEFSLPMLESKTYTLSINPDQIPEGLDANPFLMSPIVTANLAAGDVDIPAASGFVLVHKPINPASATGGGYFQADGTEQTVSWAYPPGNEAKKLSGFEVQVGLATTPFTDTSPAPVFYQPNGDPTYEFTELTGGELYRWRVRAVFETDKGPWLETAPVPTAPINGFYFPASAPGAIPFSWHPVNPVNYTGGALRYVVQYSLSPTFPALPAGNTVTLLFTTDDHNSSPVLQWIMATIRWRVQVQNSSGVAISAWSPIQTFFNRYRDLNTASFTQDDFGWHNNPIRFFANNPNPTVPPVVPVDAYYQVRLSRDGFATIDNVFTFPRTASVTIPSPRQFLDGMPGGDYQWQIAIVYGNDWHATPITRWTLGVGNITVVP